MAVVRKWSITINFCNIEPVHNHKIIILIMVQSRASELLSTITGGRLWDGVQAERANTRLNTSDIQKGRRVCWIVSVPGKFSMDRV